MGPIEIVIDKIKAIGDAIRAKTGTTAPLTLDEMAESIEFLEGSGAIPNTFILVDEDGYEIPAVLTDEVVELTATPNDIRIGTTAVTDAGVTVGEKEIPGYITSEGRQSIKPGKLLKINMYSDDCHYDKLLAAVCEYNTSLSDSVATVMVVINDMVYEPGSTTPIANVTVDSETQSISLGVSNTSSKNLVIHYMSIKENT